MIIISSVLNLVRNVVVSVVDLVTYPCRSCRRRRGPVVVI